MYDACADGPPQFGCSRRSSVSPAPRPPSRARCTARASTRSRPTTWPGAVDGAGGVRRQELSADQHRQALPRGLHQARPRARAAGIAGGRLGRLRRRAGVSAAHARRGREGGSRAHAGAARRAARSRRRSEPGGHHVPRRGRRRVQRALAGGVGRLRAGRHARRRTRATCTAPTTAASGAARRPSATTCCWSRRCTTASRARPAAAPARTCARPGRSRAPCTRPVTIQIRAYGEDGEGDAPAASRAARASAPALSAAGGPLTLTLSPLRGARGGARAEVGSRSAGEQPPGGARS